MNEEIAGYVWVDVYLLLEKVTFNNFNVSITDKGITLDMLNDKCTDNCFSGELGVLVDCGWISYITVKYEQN